MTLSNFVSKLNWRLILIHLIACWFFMYSFKLFFILHDLTFIDFANHLDNKSDNRLIAAYFQSFTPQRVSYDLLWIWLGALIGLLFGFSISLFVTIKQHWFWINSLIVFLIGLVIVRYKLLGWTYLSYVLRAPGSFFKDDTAWYYIINGTVTLTIGLLLLFLKVSIKFIDHKSHVITRNEAIST